MTVNTKGLVVTSAKDVFIVLNLATNAINQLIIDERKLKFPDVRAFRAEVREQFQSVSTTLMADTQMAQMHFTFLGQRRTLSLFFACDCDNRDRGPQSLSMSMGASGESELFIYTVLHALSLLGPAFINRCDTSDDYEEIQPRLATMAQAGGLGYVKPLDLKHWVTFAEMFSPAAPEALLGAPLDVLAAAQADYESMEAFLAAQPRVAVPHLEDYHQRQALA